MIKVYFENDDIVEMIDNKLYEQFGEDVMWSLNHIDDELILVSVFSEDEVEDCITVEYTEHDQGELNV